MASVTRVWGIVVLSSGAPGWTLVTEDAQQLREMTVSQTSVHVPWGLPMSVYLPHVDFECNSVLLFSIIDTVECTPNSSVLSLSGEPS